jgi:hypothetical protein
VESGHKIEDVAALLEFSPAKLSRVETGQVAARVQDVRELLAAYHADPATGDYLLSLTRASRQHHWSDQYPDAIPDTAREYLGLEASAATIYTYATHTIPALLQTPDYAASLESTRPGSHPDLATQHAAILGHRQQRLTQPSPPMLHAVIDESALHRHAGTDEVMNHQHAALIDTATRPHITVQVLPLSAGALSYAATPFTILTFPHPSQPPIVYTPTGAGGTTYTDTETVRQHHHDFGRLRAKAHPPDTSITLIQKTARTVRTSHTASDWLPRT